MTMRNADLLEAIEKVGEAHELWSAKYAKQIDKVTDENQKLKDRVEELESMANRPGRTAESKASREHLELFSSWLRKPNNLELKNQLAELEQKVVSIGSDPGGGFAVPEEISREIERLELKLSPVRRLVKVVQVSTGDYKHLLNLRGATSGWVGETGTRSETVTPLLREIAPTFGELYAYPQATEWSLDDMFFNIGQWLAEEVSQEFALQEGTAVISGNGTNKPTGMLNTTPVTTDDFASPLRAAAAYQFIADGPTGSPAVAQLTPDKLIDLVYKVNAAYRANATWVMNSATAGAIRKLKDSQNQYLWQMGLVAGQPERLLGYPVEIWEQMSDIGTNNFPVAFGDFSRAYVLAQRTQIRITIDSNITTPGRIKYFVRRREGGIVLSNDSIKWLRTVIV